MTLPINPYIAGAPLRAERGFFGRQNALEWVERELRNSQTNALVLFGQRRIGKTTLLLQLARNLSQEDFIPIYFDLQDQATRPLGQTLTDIAEFLCEQANVDLGQFGPFDDQGRYFQKEFLPKFYSAVGEKRRPVLLLDEFDVLDQTAEAALKETATAKALFPLLRRLMTTDGRLALVFVVGRRAEDLSIDFSATFKASLVREIWVLDKKSAEALVRQAQDNGTLLFTKDAIQRILSLTNYHPYLTQLLCQRIWELAYAFGPTAAPKIGNTEVERAVESSLETGNQALDWLWNGLNPAEKIYASALAEIADENETIVEERIIEVLAKHAARLRTREIELAPRDLVKRHVLDVSGERAYCFAVEMFRRWVHKNKPLLVVKDEVDRIDPMADRLFVFGDSFYDARQWEKAAYYFREALDVNPRHFRARLYLGETLLEQGNIDEAIAELDKALILDREEARLPLARAWLAKAELLKSEDNLDMLFKAYERVLELSPKESQAIQGRISAWVKRARLAEERGDIAAALDAYRQIGDQTNVDRLSKIERERVLKQLQETAQQHTKSEQWEEAVNIYTQMIELAFDDKSRSVWQSELENVQTQRAEQLARAKSQTIEELKKLAQTHQQAGEWEKAIEIYEKMNEIDDQAVGNSFIEVAQQEKEMASLFEQGRQALREEDWKEAQRLFAQLIQVRPDYSRNGLLAAILLQDAILHRRGRTTDLGSWLSWLRMRVRPMSAERVWTEKAKKEDIEPDTNTLGKTGLQPKIVVAVVVLGLLIIFGWGYWNSVRNNPSISATELPTTELPATELPATELPATESPSNELRVGPTSKDPTTFVNATVGEPETLDPALDYETAGIEIIQNVYETLVFYEGEATDKFVPLLAESWDLSADGTTWTFHIRSGVKFHDGADMTPSDVAYSFQRGLLQGGTASPQWLLAEPFFGVGVADVSLLVDPEGNLYDDQAGLAAADPKVLRTACEKVTGAIVADDAAGTVTMTLAQAWGPFLSTIAQAWGSVMDKDWTVANGGWDGSCDTWQNFYAIPSESNPLTAIMNGTGSFKFDHWTQGEEIVLVRNDEYWREPAEIERIMIKSIDDWSIRFEMLQAGNADAVYVRPENRSQVDQMVGERCEFDLAANEYKPCEVVDDSKPMRLYIGRPSLSSNDLFFTFNIAETSNYLGSGRLDGNGIPPDFFSDVHIRKGFAYSFDWDTYISDVFDGEAVQQPVLARRVMPGYQADAPVYALDLDKAAEEFQLADVDKDGIPAGEDPEGDVWTTGFRLQALYNQGNTSRQIVSEILAANLGTVNELFAVETVGLPWPTFLSALRASETPYFVSGWAEDLHDPHNWYTPYMVGVYARRQKLPDELQAQFREILDRGVVEIEPAARDAIYKEANQLYYDQVPTVLLATQTSHSFIARYVQGEILNPIFYGFYYYTMYKQ